MIIPEGDAMMERIITSGSSISMTMPYETACRGIQPRQSRFSRDPPPSTALDPVLCPRRIQRFQGRRISMHAIIRWRNGQKSGRGSRPLMAPEPEIVFGDLYVAWNQRPAFGRRSPWIIMTRSCWPTMANSPSGKLSASIGAWMRGRAAALRALHHPAQAVHRPKQHHDAGPTCVG